MSATSEKAGGLLERSTQFGALRQALEDARGRSRGRLALVGGEAGAGKTALLRRFCDEHERAARVLWGACDGLFTPRPLGPLLDIAESTGGELADVVASGARPHEVAAALLREIATRAPTVVVLEDVHWADEATLDVVRLAARRIEALPVLLIASYRDDELGPEHPLVIVLGELATSRGIERLTVPRLSPAAVAAMAEPHGVDADQLYRRTAGNPFFVTEALAAGEEEIPPTVRDAVLARAARVGPAARALLEAVAIVPPQAELWLLEGLAGAATDQLGECLSAGVLTPASGGVAYRHELARLAVEGSIAPNRKLALHRTALALLAGPPSGGLDLDRLAHHAEAAGDACAVLRFAPAAAARAASLGAHREAAAQYARALRFADGLPPGARAELLERRSHECYVADLSDDAIDALERALECHRMLDDPRKEGDALRALSAILWCPGRVADAHATGLEAVSLLERFPAGRELAMAYANLASLHMNAEDADGTADWGGRALALAERLDEARIRSHALNTLGTMEFLRGGPGERGKAEESVELAERLGHEEEVLRGLANLAWAATRHRAHALADRYLDAGLEYAVHPDHDLWRLYLLGYRARSQLHRGQWDEAVATAQLVLRDRRTSPLPAILGLVVIGLVRARRGEPDPWPPLDEASALAWPSGELQRIEPVAGARAEAAWLEGRVDRVDGETERVLELARRRGVSVVVDELGFWRTRAGGADRWAALGCPYEAALARAESGDEEALRAALEDLQRLGAGAAAAIVTRRLRERGARDVPRGPRAATRENPANLTPREVEVLGLVAEGLRNRDIAERLFLSEKTVGHHVSAILRKLDLDTRGQAGAEARRLGLVQQP